MDTPPTSHPSSDRLPGWLAEALDVLSARRRIVVATAVGLVLLGAILALVAPSILPARAVVGAAVGIAAALLATALALAMDASDLVVRGVRHVRAAGGTVDVHVGRQHDDVGPLLAAVARHASGGPVRVALSSASRTAGVPGVRAGALAEALARTGRKVLLTDLARGGTPAAGLSDVITGSRTLPEVVRFEQELYLARLAVGSDPDAAIRGFAGWVEGLPSDLEVLVAALPPLADPGVLVAAGAMDVTFVLVEVDRTERVDLIASLDAVDASGLTSELVLIDPERAVAATTADTPPVDDAAPVDDALPVGDAPPVHDAPPAEGAPPAEDADEAHLDGTPEPLADEGTEVVAADDDVVAQDDAEAGVAPAWAGEGLATADVAHEDTGPTPESTSDPEPLPDQDPAADATSEPALEDAEKRTGLDTGAPWEPAPAADPERTDPSGRTDDAGEVAGLLGGLPPGPGTVAGAPVAGDEPSDVDRPVLDDGAEHDLAELEADATAEIPLPAPADDDLSHIWDAPPPEPARGDAASADAADVAAEPPTEPDHEPWPAPSAPEPESDVDHHAHVDPTTDEEPQPEPELDPEPRDDAPPDPSPGPVPAPPSPASTRDLGADPAAMEVARTSAALHQLAQQIWERDDR